MPVSYFSADIAINTVLQVAQCLHNEFMTNLRNLQRDAMAIIGQSQDSCLAQITTKFESLSESMRLELDIDAKYDEALKMCNNETDLKILQDFSKERQMERMSLVRQISQIESNEQLPNAMNDFINYVRSLDCPCCRAESNRDQEMENMDVSNAASN